MATPAPSPVPQGMHTLTPELYFDGRCGEAIEFYKKAFAATEPMPPFKSPDGKTVWHAMLKIGDSNLMMADEWPGMWEQAPRSCATGSLYAYFADCDAIFSQAVAAGCEVMAPLADMFWGDRFGKLKDPFGHTWGIATNKWIYTPEEMVKGRDAWLASMGG